MHPTRRSILAAAAALLAAPGLALASDPEMTASIAWSRDGERLGATVWLVTSTPVTVRVAYGAGAGAEVRAWIQLPNGHVDLTEEHDHRAMMSRAGPRPRWETTVANVPTNLGTVWFSAVPEGNDVQTVVTVVTDHGSISLTPNPSSV